MGVLVVFLKHGKLALGLFQGLSQASEVILQIRGLFRKLLDLLHFFEILSQKNLSHDLVLALVHSDDFPTWLIDSLTICVQSQT